MEFVGNIECLGMCDDKVQIHLSASEKVDIDKLAEMRNELVDVYITKYHERRSLDANKLLWACLGEIASALGADKWDIYMMMLKRYGKFTYVLVPNSAVDVLRGSWRASEVIGTVDVNGRESTQLLLYYGSSMMNTKEFSTLLEGVFSEMKDIGLTPPPSRKMREALAALEGK